MGVNQGVIGEEGAVLFVYVCLARQLHNKGIRVS